MLHKEDTEKDKSIIIWSWISNSSNTWWTHVEMEPENRTRTTDISCPDFVTSPVFEAWAELLGSKPVKLHNFNLGEVCLYVLRQESISDTLKRHVSGASSDHIMVKSSNRTSSACHWATQRWGTWYLKDIFDTHYYLLLTYWTWRRGSNLNTNVNYATWPTSCNFFISSKATKINCVEFKVLFRSFQDAQTELSSVAL